METLGPKIEVKNLCPMVAMISAGKTSILKVIFDIDFLEATAGIGTKFVNIIRYNPSLGKNPKFYHLIVKNMGNNNYEFYKDPNFKEIIGKDNIKQKNKELNAEFKSKNAPYEEIFYMIEVGEANFIEDKEYLANYDLVDIPGVNEYTSEKDEVKETTEKPSENKVENLPPPDPFLSDFIENMLEVPKEEEKGSDGAAPQTTQSIYDTMEDEMKIYDPSKEKNYLTEIFRILKNKMNNGIIVFSVDNYQHAENYRIIAKLQKVINKPIENFLILLNKIDKSEDREYDLNTLNSKIMKYFPSAKVFNPTKNHIYACSKIQLENESKMDKSFKHLLYYHFLNFLMISRPTSSGTPTTSGLTFIDFLKDINHNKSINKKILLEKINKIIEDNNFSDIIKEITEIITFLKNEHRDDDLNLGVRDDDFKEEEIKKIYEDLQNDEGEEEQEDGEGKKDFNVENLEGNILILYYYSEFKQKKNIPPRSEDTQNIMDYFTMQNMNKTLEINDKALLEENKKKILEEKTLNNKIDDISKRMMEFYEEYQKENVRKENLEQLRKYINSSIGILKTSKLLYIPMLGVSNAGKSTILNGIIGQRVLPAQKNECTKKGILIKHWEKDYPVIRKTRFKKEKLGSDDIYFFEPDEDIIARDIDKIHRVLEGTNGEFSGKEEDFFYEIDINIKFINDLKIEDNLKEKICFIDLPGFGTNNEFEKKGVYAHLMKSCNIFLFVVFNLKIRETDNKRMLDSLYHQMSEYRGIPAQAFIKKCLFIINFDKDQDISEKSFNQAKNDIISVVDGLEKDNLKDLNVCFFNAKYYENYIFKLLYYHSAEKLLEYEHKNFKKLIEKAWKMRGGDKIKVGTFNNYIKKQLKDNIGNDIKTKFDEKIVKENQGIEKEVRNFISLKKLKFSEKDIKLISKYITYGKENLSQSDLLTQSNIDPFTRDLLISINKAKTKADEEINISLKHCFKILDNVFEVDPNTKFGQCKDEPIAKIVKPHVQEDLNNLVSIIEKQTNLINSEFSKNDIVSIMTSCSQNISSALTSHKSNIGKDLRSKNYKKIQKEFEDTFTNETTVLKTQLNDALESASTNIKNYLDFCYDNLDKFYSQPCERKDLLYKNYISNCLGGNNDIETTINQLIDDIISGSRHATDKKNCDGFFNWLGTKIFDDSYLNKTIDYMISKSTPKIKTFSDNIKTESDKFKRDIIDEINSSKNRVVKELEQKRQEEEIAINLANAKNEEEREKWEKEKNQLEFNKRKWEQLCKKYRILRDEITGLRLTNEFDTPEK